MFFATVSISISPSSIAIDIVPLLKVLPAIIIAQVEPMFIMGRQTFIREASSKMYSQVIFATAQLAAETPYSVLCAVGMLSFLL